MAKFQVGDYVCKSRMWTRSGKEIVGKVVKVDADFGHTAYVVNWLNPDYKTSFGNDYISETWLKPAPLEIDEAALKELFMDLALITKDYVWLKEISTSIKK